MSVWKRWSKRRRKQYDEYRQKIYSQIWNEHKQFMYNYAMRLTLIRAEAEDLVSNVWKVLMENADEVLAIMDDSVRMRSYIGRVMLYEGMRFRRDTAVRNKYEELYGIMQSSNGAVSEAAGEEAVSNIRQQDIMQAIKKLPMKYQTVIMMRYFEEKSGEEIAESLGVSLANAYQYMSRAKQKLKVILIEEGIIEEGYDYDEKEESETEI